MSNKNSHFVLWMTWVIGYCSQHLKLQNTGQEDVFATICNHTKLFQVGKTKSEKFTQKKKTYGTFKSEISHCSVKLSAMSDVKSSKRQKLPVFFLWRDSEF